MKENQAIIVVDIGFGDAGKGTLVDFLAKKFSAHTVVRYNGGAQAGHNIVTPDGRQHVFSQFGSATFQVGVRTHLSEYMLIDPLSMLSEERHLYQLGVTDAFERTTVDESAVITTPFHQAVNRLKEIARGSHRSCGMGIRETTRDAKDFGDRVLRVKDLKDPVRMVKKLEFLRQLQLEKVSDFRNQLPITDATTFEMNVLNDPQGAEITGDVYEHFESKIKIVDTEFARRMIRQQGTVLFEGAQGVLLDPTVGFEPYVTSTNTSTSNAEEMLVRSDYWDRRIKLGVTRTYATRHGDGPLVTEDAFLTARLPDTENRSNQWQGDFRVGYFDQLLASYAIAATNGVDYLALTHLDRVRDIPDLKICEAYLYQGEAVNDAHFNFMALNHLVNPTRLVMEALPIYSQLGKLEAEEYLDEIQKRLRVPVAVASYGPGTDQKKLRIWS